MKAQNKKDALRSQEMGRWSKLAAALPAERLISLGVPIVNYLEEAEKAAGFLRRSWTPADSSLPAMSSLEAFLPLRTADEIQSLVRACRVVHTEVLLPESVPADDQITFVERGRELAADLGACLQYVLDDGVTEPADLALEAALKRQTEGTGAAVLAQALSDLARIAEQSRDKLARIRGFDLGLVAEARALSDRLTEKPSATRGRPASPLVDLRNRLLTLLDQRVAEVRRAGRFLYRKHPAELRQLASEYARRQRAARQRRVQGAAGGPAAAPNGGQGQVTAPAGGQGQATAPAGGPVTAPNGGPVTAPNGAAAQPGASSQG